jgi:TonB family protein
MNLLIYILALVAAGGAQSVPVEVFPVVFTSIDYPLLGVQAQIEGEVMLDAVIRSSGEVTQATLVSGHRVLGETAQSAIKSWRFAYRCPGQGGPDEATVRFYFTFRLQGVVSGRPRTRTTFIFPDRVTIVGEAVHYQPATAKKS